jgi:hypothetical protein
MSRIYVQAYNLPLTTSASTTVKRMRSKKIWVKKSHQTKGWLINLESKNVNEKMSVDKI